MSAAVCAATAAARRRARPAAGGGGGGGTGNGYLVSSATMPALPVGLSLPQGTPGLTFDAGTGHFTGAVYEPEAPDTTGYTVVTCTAADDLQTKVNEACGVTGGVILSIAADVVESGPITIGARPNNLGEWMLVQVANADAVLPARGTHLHGPSYEALLPTINNGGSANNRCLILSATTLVWLRGLNVHNSPAPSLGASTTSLVDVYSTSTHIVFEHCFIHGYGANESGNSAKNGVTQHGQHVRITCSDIRWIQHVGGEESHAIISFSGVRYMTVDRCFLGGGSIGIMFGGADSASASDNPQDVHIYLCAFHKPGWMRTMGGLNIKNIVESKNSQRVVVERCILDGSWPDGQSGMAFSFKSENQNGGTTGEWAETVDVVARYNWVRNATRFAQIAKSGDLPEDTPLKAQRLEFCHNLGTDLALDSGQYLFGTGAQYVVLDHNTLALVAGGATNGWMSTDGGWENLTLTNNVAPVGTYGAKASGFSAGQASIDGKCAPVLAQGGNLWHGNTFNSVIAADRNTTGAPGFTNEAADDYTLTGASLGSGLAVSGYADAGYEQAFVLGNLAPVDFDAWSSEVSA